MLITILALSVIYATESITIVSRSAKLENFPCSQCHKDGKFKKEIKLPLTEQHQQFQTKHMEGDTDCYRCHDKNNFDQFILDKERTVQFDDSYLLCMHCHGDKKSDWENGIHGKQTGFWDGEKKRLSCTACHNPHTPKIAPTMPERGPDIPKLSTKNQRGSHE